MNRNKYKVSPADQRRFNGRTYGSKAERDYAEQLFMLYLAGEITTIIEQPRQWLGVPENVYVPDFFVMEKNGEAYFIDVKGMETAKFNRDKKLWRAYGRLPLVIVKRSGKRFKVTETLCDTTAEAGAA